jgi:hypothetical protein
VLYATCCSSWPAQPQKDDIFRGRRDGTVGMGSISKAGEARKKIALWGSRIGIATPAWPPSE